MKTLFRCECGTEKEIATGDVRHGKTKACGCLMKTHSAKEMLTPQQIAERVPTIVIESLPPLISPNSAKVVSYRCPDCSAVLSKRMFQVLHNPGAANCDCHFVSPDELLKKRGKLLYFGDPAARVNRFGHATAPFLCDCGKTTHRAVKTVFGDVSAVYSCGKCNEHPPEWWNGRRFGSLAVSGVSTPIAPHSTRKVRVTCVCGYSYDRMVCTLKPTCKCPMCGESAKRWWADKPMFLPRGTVCSLEYLQEFFTGHTIAPLEGCRVQRDPIRFRCLLCEREYTTTVNCIMHKRTYSCGCAFTRISRSAIEVADYLRGIASHVEYEFQVGKWSYDIRADNLLVEYHGSKFHKERVSERDEIKRQVAHDAGFRYVIVMESEWKKAQQALTRDRLTAFLHADT